MDRYVLVITPVRADPAFTAKMGIVRAQCRTLEIGCRVPETNPDKFDLDAAIAAIHGAALILADLSYARASCYYELGLIEGAGRSAMLLAETGTEIFQHSGRDAVAFYDDLTSYEALIVRTLAGIPRAIS
jgi:hypothetical protein